MSKIFPKWISPRAFFLAALISVIPSFGAINFSGFSAEVIVQLLLQAFFGGLFWGWIFKKFLPKYFGKKD